MASKRGRPPSTYKYPLVKVSVSPAQMEKIDNSIVANLLQRGGKTTFEYVGNDLFEVLPGEVREKIVNEQRFIEDRLRILRKDRLLTVSPDKTIEITPLGEKKVERVIMADIISEEVKKGSRPEEIERKIKTYNWKKVKIKKGSGTVKDAVKLIKSMSRGKISPSESTIRKWAKDGHIKEEKIMIPRSKFDLKGIQKFVSERCGKSKTGNKIRCRLKD